MKKLFTLVAVGAMAATSFDAQAQAPITVNGQLAATEVTANGYKLVGRVAGTGSRGFGDAGLLALYAAADADNLYFFVAGTLETQSAGTIANSIQLFIDRPGVTGASATASLPAPTGATGTSFSGMTARLDMAPDLALAIKGNGTAAQLQVEGVAYTSATAATVAVLAPTLATNGTATTVAAGSATGNLAGFAGAQVAYTTSANLSSNPGFASNGNAPSNGLEIRVSRTAMGLPAAGGNIQLFVLQNNQDGSFLSSDYIPSANPTAPFTNLGSASSVNFANVPGTQAATVAVTNNNLTVTSSRRADEAAVALNVYPNPSQGDATIAYRVLDRSQPVRIELTDLMGRQVRTVFDGQQAAGLQSQTINSAAVAAGTYLVKVKVSELVATRKVTLL